MKRPFAGRLLIMLIITVASTKSHAQAPVVGVLEERPGHYFGEPNFRVIRVVFTKTGSEWKPFPNDCRKRDCLKAITSNYPKTMRWTIGFDGRQVGQLASTTPDDFRWYSDIGQQVISGSNIPTVGTPSPEFAGYVEAKVHRPLIANSQPHLADPERWKPTALSPDLTNVLRHAFRKKFPKLCRMSKVNENNLEPFVYQEEDVKAIKAYASSKGVVIARMHLEAIDCEDAEAGFDIDDPWFSMGTNKVPKYMDSGMWLVDAGDYDNDGKSELIFSISRENEGGYEIWYDGFRKHSVFKFNYH